MGMVKCGECGRPVSTSAKVCPHCGYDPRGGGRGCDSCSHCDAEDGCYYSDKYEGICAGYSYWDHE